MFLVLLVVLGCAGTVRSGDDVGEADLEGFPLIVRSEENPAVLVTTVVDARNGRPIAGAIVRGYFESTDGRAVAVNALAVSLTTDAYGLAISQTDTQALSVSHWVVSAAGYRPYADYHGYFPPERVDLEPATPMAVQILDPYGDPVVDAVIEGYSGCPHAPPAVGGRTDGRGMFRVADGSPDGFSMWVEAPGCACSPDQMPPVFGDAPCVEVMRPGISIEGRVRDEDGRPIPGAVLRGANYPRGPATLTDLQGRFVLQGLAPTEALHVFHPTIYLDGPHTIDRVVGDVPLDLVWTTTGFREQEGAGTLRIRARGPGGLVAEGLQLLVLAPNGEGQEAVTDSDGEVTLDLAPGRYRVRGDDPFGPFDVAEGVAALTADEEVTLDLALCQRPLLRIQGQVPPGLDGGIVAVGRFRHLLDDSDEHEPAQIWLPAEARAVIELRDFEGWAHFVSVGPVADGVRTGVIDVPLPHRVRLTDGGELDESHATLSPREHPDVERIVHIVEGAIAVRWGGRFLLTVKGGKGASDLVVDLDLPPLGVGGVERLIDFQREQRPIQADGEALLHVRRADGQTVSSVHVSSGTVGTAWSSTRSTDDAPLRVWAPSRVLLNAPGLYPLQVDVKHTGEHTIVVPAAGIDLTMLDAIGAPAEATVLVNGVYFDAPLGTLSLRGFPEGEHAVIVQRTMGASVSRSIRWRFNLTEGEVRTRTLTLP